ncbi:MAG: M23 family metallopeptidase [Anaerolineae bacterium]|nr:M23 family metallopeptidase [Anaerolineae bacterium]
MTRLFLTLIVFLLGVGATAPALAQAPRTVQITPREIPQGRTALIRLPAFFDDTRAAANFAGTQFPLYRSADGEWVGFLAVEMDAERGEVPLEVLVWRGDELLPPLMVPVSVVWGGFLYQDVVLPYTQTDLLDPVLNNQETATLLRVYSRQTPEKYWEGAFGPSVPGVMISEFGGIRTYNNGVLTGRHTGIDFRAITGEPVRAAGHGRVVFTSRLPIRGNHVVIDHGWGVLTGYSHLSEINVVPGQRVLAGDVIGAAGATGRVQGSHLHLEVAVNGVWVDAMQFMSLSVPEAPLIFAGGR